MAVASLIIAYGNLGFLEYVDETHTDDYPKGVSWKVTKNLDKRFSPKDEGSEVEENSELTKVKFKKGNDPKMLVRKLKLIDRKFKCCREVEGENLVSHLMPKARHAHRLLNPNRDEEQ